MPNASPNFSLRIGLLYLVSEARTEHCTSCYVPHKPWMCCVLLLSSTPKAYTNRLEMDTFNTLLTSFLSYHVCVRVCMCANVFKNAYIIGHLTFV